MKLLFIVKETNSSTEIRYKIFQRTLCTSNNRAVTRIGHLKSSKNVLWLKRLKHKLLAVSLYLYPLTNENAGSRMEIWSENIFNIISKSNVWNTQFQNFRLLQYKLMILRARKVELFYLQKWSWDWNRIYCVVTSICVFRFVNKTRIQKKCEKSSEIIM